ncbi:MAG TPA: hypothetical protein VNS88_14280 [Nitrospiraceae bacterium]|nr:hypothetical protein [Nitrospiraceae bacterium]
MIGKDELSESARYMDALSEEHGFDKWADLTNVHPDGLMYVAEQRALRAAMLIDGQDPTLLSRTQKTSITLSPEVQKLMPHLTGLSMDGIGIGLHAGRQDD